MNYVRPPVTDPDAKQRCAELTAKLTARERELRWACTQLLELGELYRKAIPTDRAQAILTTLPQETP